MGEEETTFNLKLIAWAVYRSMIQMMLYVKTYAYVYI